MNRKRREKKQAEASGTKPVTIDFETRSSYPFRDRYSIGEFMLQYKTRSDFPSVSEHAFNTQLATYASAAAKCFHDNMELADKLHWGIATTIDRGYAELGTKTHRRLEEMADADYAVLETRTMAWYAERWEREYERALYGIVNHGPNKPLDLDTEPAMSTSRITIAKMTGN